MASIAGELSRPVEDTKVNDLVELTRSTMHPVSDTEPAVVGRIEGFLSDRDVGKRVFECGSDAWADGRQETIEPNDSDRPLPCETVSTRRRFEQAPVHPKVRYHGIDLEPVRRQTCSSLSEHQQSEVSRLADPALGGLHAKQLMHSAQPDMRGWIPTQPRGAFERQDVRRV